MLIQNPTLKDLLTTLEKEPVEEIVPVEPGGEPVAPHYHVTELGRIQKDFIDCGGTVRQSVAAQLQLLVAADTDHRIKAEKLAKIIHAASPIMGEGKFPLTVEYGETAAVVYPVSEMKVEGTSLHLQMQNPSTACLAPDTCGLSPEEARVDAYRIEATTRPPGSGCC